MPHGLADGLAGGGVPQPRRLVLAPGDDVFPSGLNATDPKFPECSGIWPRGWPVAGSHSRAVLSRLPVTTVFPSGLKATEFTGFECGMG